jgi:hypothetical protein
MKSAAATAGMLSAAILLAPGCERRPEPRNSKEEPVRRATYLAALARELLETCPAGGVPAREASRYGELTRLGVQSGAGHAIWLGENDVAAVNRVSPVQPCAAGEAPRQAALAAYSRALDTLAGRIAEYRP